MRRAVAGWLIRLAHRIYRPHVTVTIYPHDHAVRCTGESIEHVAAAVKGYQELMAAHRQASRWN